MAKKTYYSHHISYWSDWRPSSVTTTNRSTWQTTTKAVSRSSGGRWSSSSRSGWGSSSSKSNTSYNFVDPSVLHDAQINWLNRAQIDAKWWTWTSNSIDKYDQTYNKGWQTSREYWASRKSWWSSSGSNSNWWSSANTDYITSMQFWQWTANDYQKNRNNTLWKYYSDLGKLDYNSIYNDLSRNSWFASSSENDKRATVNKIMEQAANAKWWTLTGKSDDEIAAEQRDNNEDENARLDDVLWEFWEEWEEEPYSYDFDELFWDWADRYESRIADLESQLESNTIKTSVPEERDTSYDYNTYYKENLAPDNNYENWESKNTLNEKPQVTLVSQYQEPVSTALNDLGLLTPNEAVTNETPNAEEPDLPKGYENWEDIVTDFENQLQSLWEEWETGLTPQAVAQTYANFKNQLLQYANNNKLSKEEFEALLWQLKWNEILRNVLSHKRK